MKEYFKKLSPREKKMLSMLAFILLLYGLYALVFEGNIQALSDKRDQLTALEQREEQMSMELFSYNLLKERYSAFDLDKLEEQLPSQGKFHEIILWLDGLFDNSAISTPTMGFSVAAEEEVKYMQITLTFSGSYTDIYSLVEEIEGNTRVTTVERMNLSGTQDSLTANLVIHVYGQNFTDIGLGEFDFQNDNLFRGN